MNPEEEKNKKTPEPAQTENKKESNKKEFWDLFRFAIIAILIVIPIRIFIAQPFIVSGLSMYPTFDNAQYLVVDELSYRFENPQRDDVIVFRYPLDTTKFFIKRIIGLPGETVDIKNGDQITITNAAHPQGFLLSEPFVQNESTTGDTHIVLTNNEYFVMGDNRTASSDSRYWGPVPKNLIIGRVFLRLLPFTKAGIWPGNYKQPIN